MPRYHGYRLNGVLKRPSLTVIRVVPRNIFVPEAIWLRGLFIFHVQKGEVFMRKIIVSDMTLQKYASSLSFKEKIEVARHLDHLKVDVIHMPAIENVKTDSLLIRTVSAFIKDSVICAPVGMSRESVEIAAAAVSGAKKARLVVSLPVSPVQMEYACHKKAPKMLELAKELFVASVLACGDVEFFAEDATRADKAFLAEMISAAIEAGVKTVTLCDDEGAMLPDEIFAFVSEMQKDIPALAKTNIGIRCKDVNGMATASAVMAMKAGATEIKCSVGVKDIPDLETFAGILNNCGDRCGVASGVNYDELHRIVGQIEWICGTGDKPASKNDAFASADENAVFDVHDSAETIAAAVVKLGYDLSAEDNDRVYEEFLRVAEKKTITLKDLDAVVASVALQVPATYRLVSYVVNNGNIISSSAQITLEKDGEQISGISIGDGPVDAAFRTIDQIVGHHFELDDFQIQSVTEGREAVGSALVRLRNDGKLYSGKGISTDIIGASIRAYVNAVNKIIYEEMGE